MLTNRGEGTGALSPSATEMGQPVGLHPLTEAELTKLETTVAQAQPSIDARQPDPYNPGLMMGFKRDWEHASEEQKRAWQEEQMLASAAAYRLHGLWERYGQRVVAELRYARQQAEKMSKEYWEMFHKLHPESDL